MSDTVDRETSTQRTPEVKQLPDLSAHGLTLEVVGQPTFGNAKPVFSFRMHGPGITVAEPFLRDLGFRYNPVTGHWSSSAALNIARMSDFLPNGIYEKGVKSIAAVDYAPLIQAPAPAVAPVAAPAPRVSRTVVPPPASRAVPASIPAAPPPSNDAPPAGRPAEGAFGGLQNGLFGGVVAPSLPPAPPPAVQPSAAPTVGASVQPGEAEAKPGGADPTRARSTTRRRFQDIGPSLFDLPEFTSSDLPPATRATAPRQPSAASPAALDMNNSVVLGVNAQGNVVRRLADGRRLTESRSGYRHLEEPGRPAGFYLRAETQADLRMIAEGVINQLSEGKHVSAPDMSRLAAIMAGGDGNSPPDPADVRRLLAEADDLMMEKIGEAKPATRSRAIAARFHRFSAQGWRDLDVARDTIPVRRIFSEINATEVMEVAFGAVTSDWVADTLAPQLSALPDNARLLLRITTDSTIGAEEFRSGVFAPAVRQNIIESVAHLRRPMASHNQALLVFGQPRPIAVDPTAIPLEAFDAPVISSSEEAWEWLDRTEAASALARQWMEDFRAGRVVATPEEARAPNQFQTPYVGLSKGQVRNLMVPSALADATAEALQNLAGRVGDADEFVAREIGIPVAQLVDRFTGPQVDGAALIMDAHDRNRGFLLGDTMGAGKTRALAAVARRAINQGHQVIFTTEKSASFGDIIAEFQRCGLDDGINWYVMNAGVEIQTDENGVAFTIGSKAKNQAAKKGYRTGDVMVPMKTAAQVKADLFDDQGNPRWPEGVNVLLCSYSQVNKEINYPRHSPKATPEEIQAANKAAEDKDWKTAWFRKINAENVVALLDEAHNLASPTSITSRNLTNLVEKAYRVTYATGTAGNEPKQMGVYFRLLPGNNPDAKTQLPAMLARGGLEAAEALTVAFVADGVARRCGLDFSDVAVRVLLSPNGEHHRETLYSLAPTLQGIMTLAKVMKTVVEQQNMFEASRARQRLMEQHGLTPEQMRAEWTKDKKRGQYRAMGFSSPLYSIERAFAAVILAREIGDYAADLLMEGKKPIIQIDNTMHTALEEVYKSEAPEDGEAVEVVPTMRHYLRRLVRQVTRVKRGERQVTMEALDERQRRTFLVRDEAARVLEGLAQIIEETDAATPFEDLEALRAWLDTTVVEAVSAERLAFEARQPLEADPLDIVLAADGEALEGEILPPQAPIVLNRTDWNDIQSISELLVENVFDTLVVTPSNVAQGFRGEAEKLRQNREIDPQMRAAMDLIENLPAEADLPLSYIDVIKERVAGSGFKMLEMTNRTLEVHEGKIRPREPEEIAVVKHAFQNTHGTGLIIGASGAASIGLHAAPDALDQSQRVFVPMQWFSDPNKQAQITGRFKRAGEVAAPEIHYFFSGIPSEARHVSMMNRRYARLGANTEAARSSPLMISNVPDFHSPEGDKATARFLLDHPDMIERLGIEITQEALAEIAGRQAARTTEVEGEQDNEMAEGTRKSDKAVASLVTREHQRLGNEVLMAATLLGRDQADVLDGVTEQYWALLEEYEALGIEVGSGRKVDGEVRLRGQMVLDPELPPAPGEPPSVFDKAVMLNVITIKRDIAPMRGQDVIELVDQAVMEGASRTFYSAGVSNMHTADQREINAIESTGQVAAYAQANINRLRMNAERLHNMQPGQGIDCVSAHYMGTGIILRLTGDSEFNRRMDIVFPGDAKVRSISLPAALSQDVYSIHEGLHGPQREAILQAFDTAESEKKVEVRYLLTGSEPRMLSTDMGRFTLYTDSNGQTKRGLLVSRKHEKLNKIKNRVPSSAIVMTEMARLGQIAANEGFEETPIVEYTLARGHGQGTKFAGAGCLEFHITAEKRNGREMALILKLTNGSSNSAFKIDEETFAKLTEVAGGDLVRLFLDNTREGYGISAIQRQIDTVLRTRHDLQQQLNQFVEAGQQVPHEITNKLAVAMKVKTMTVVPPMAMIGINEEENLTKLLEIIPRLHEEGYLAVRSFQAAFSLNDEGFIRTVTEGGPIIAYGLSEIEAAPLADIREERDTALTRARQMALEEWAQLRAAPRQAPEEPAPDMFGGN